MRVGDRISRKVANGFGGVDGIGFAIHLVGVVGGCTGSANLMIKLDVRRKIEVDEFNLVRSDEEIAVDATRNLFDDKLGLSWNEISTVQTTLEESLNKLRSSGEVEAFAADVSRFQTEDLYRLQMNICRTDEQDAELAAKSAAFEERINA